MFDTMSFYCAQCAVTVWLSCFSTRLMCVLAALLCLTECSSQDGLPQVTFRSEKAWEYSCPAGAERLVQEVGSSHCAFPSRPSLRPTLAVRPVNRVMMAVVLDERLLPGVYITIASNA
jgi:hypothetical protein